VIPDDLVIGGYRDRAKEVGCRDAYQNDYGGGDKDR